MILNIGLCLCGGGAKGAYQAGVIKALYDRGINKFNSIAGTSIGSINGYFLFTDNVDKLEEIWTNINENIETSIRIVNNTVDNSEIIEILSKLYDKSSEKMNFYVNYINIENNIPKEEILQQYEYMDKIQLLSQDFCSKNGRMPVARVRNFGCQMNEHDAEKLTGMLLKMGYKMSNSDEDKASAADLIIFNTCCVR